VPADDGRQRQCEAPADNGRQRQQEVGAPQGKSHASSRQEMAAQQEAEAAQLRQCNNQLTEQTRAKQEAEALGDKRRRRNERAGMDNARLAGGGQQ
jgi:hypothetical protein